MSRAACHAPAECRPPRRRTCGSGRNRARGCLRKRNAFGGFFAADAVKTGDEIDRITGSLARQAQEAPVYRAHDERWRLVVVKRTMSGQQRPPPLERYAAGDDGLDVESHPTTSLGAAAYTIVNAASIHEIDRRPVRGCRETPRTCHTRPRTRSQSCAQSCRRRNCCERSMRRTPRTRRPKAGCFRRRKET